MKEIWFSHLAKIGFIASLSYLLLVFYIEGKADNGITMTLVCLGVFFIIILPLGYFGFFRQKK